MDKTTMVFGALILTSGILHFYFYYWGVSDGIKLGIQVAADWSLRYSNARTRAMELAELVGIEFVSLPTEEQDRRILDIMNSSKVE